MTNQEAIESFRNANKAAELQLKAHRDIMDASEIKEFKRLIERDSLAIKALEQESCEDAVSRSEFEKRIKPYDTEDGMDKELYNFAHNILISCPSVQPQRVDWDGMIETIKLESEESKNFIPKDCALWIELDDVIEIINKYRNGGQDGIQNNNGSTR